MKFLKILLLTSILLLVACQSEQAETTPTNTISPTEIIFNATAVPTEGALFATPTSTLTPTITLTPTTTPTFTLTPTVTSSPTLTFTPSITPTPERTDHFVFSRPIASSEGNFIDRTYPYGSTQNGRRQVHHGVEFINPRGTPVLAVGGGTVIYAGSDSEIEFGPRTDFYGNLVVIEHGVTTFDGLTVYSLYGHLDRVVVEEGDRVQSGDRIGIVGDTGIADGPHLHFEIRVGDAYDYNATQNPDLWLFPLPSVGTLAGRVLNRTESPIQDITVTIRRAGTNPISPFYAYTYASDDVNSTVVWEENFTRGDLREGDYDIYISNRNGRVLFETIVTIEAGETTWLEIILNETPNQ